MLPRLVPPTSPRDDDYDKEFCSAPSSPRMTIKRNHDSLLTLSPMPMKRKFSGSRSRPCAPVQIIIPPPSYNAQDVVETEMFSDALTSPRQHSTSRLPALAVRQQTFKTMRSRLSLSIQNDDSNAFIHMLDKNGKHITIDMKKVVGIGFQFSTEKMRERFEGLCTDHASPFSLFRFLGRMVVVVHRDGYTYTQWLGWLMLIILTSM